MIEVTSTNQRLSQSVKDLEDTNKKLTADLKEKEDLLATTNIAFLRDKSDRLLVNSNSKSLKIQKDKEFLQLKLKQLETAKEQDSLLSKKLSDDYQQILRINISLTNELEEVKRNSELVSFKISYKISGNRKIK